MSHELRHEPSITVITRESSAIADHVFVLQRSGSGYQSIGEQLIAVLIKRGWTPPKE